MPDMWRLVQQESASPPHQKQASLVVSYLTEGATYPCFEYLVIDPYCIIHGPEKKESWKTLEWWEEIQT